MRELTGAVPALNLVTNPLIPRWLTDFNGDGKPEIAVLDGRFEHGFGLSRSASPEIMRVSAWDGTTYTDVSRGYTGYLKDQADRAKSAVEATFGQPLPDQDTIGRAVTVLMGYELAGQRDEGWTLFWQLSDPVNWNGEAAAGLLEWMSRIRDYLKGQYDRGEPFAPWPPTTPGVFQPSSAGEEPTLTAETTATPPAEAPPSETVPPEAPPQETLCPHPQRLRRPIPRLLRVVRLIAARFFCEMKEFIYRHGRGLLAMALIVLAVSFFHARGLRPGFTFLPVDLAQANVPWRTTPPDRLQNELISDPLYQFYPFLTFTVSSLKAHSWPLWNPYILMGHPSFADPSGANFLPCVCRAGSLAGFRTGHSHRPLVARSVGSRSYLRFPPRDPMQPVCSAAWCIDLRPERLSGDLV